MGTSLRYFRDQRKLTQEELSELTGITRSTIARLEAGTQQPRARTWRKLARALKIDLVDLEREPPHDT